VSLISTLADGATVQSEPVPLTVLETFATSFYDPGAAAAAPPTAAPTAEPPSAATPEPAPEATPTAPETLTATARNGGNIRQDPSVGGEVIGQISAGEVLELRARSADGQWYLLRAGEAEGWVSATLLEVPDAAEDLPIEGAATGLTAAVFNGGNVRAAPSLQGEVLDQINAGETVTLLGQNIDGNWYQITNVRGVTGWVSVTLLTITPEVSSQVPVTDPALPSGPPSDPAAPTSVAITPPAGLTATVFNGGNVRSAPNLSGQVLDQINARESVTLLAKTADGNWYQITNVRGVTGWVNRTLLTVDPEVARRVPVA
jgi:flagellar FliL protein